MLSGPDPQVQIFSSIKYRIMQLLKREGRADLRGLSKKLLISQMAVYKHMKELEGEGLVEHESQRNGVGRPKLVFKLSSRSTGVYPKGYSKVATMLLEYVRDARGDEGMKEAFDRLRDRTIGEYSPRTGDGGLYEKAKRVASARDSDGYFAEARVSKNGAVELIEHNCPVSALACKYPEICEAERQAFESILNAKVEAVSLNQSNLEACRFRILPN